eukprot:g1196.t1
MKKLSVMSHPTLAPTVVVSGGRTYWIAVFSIIGRIDEMGSRIDELEASIGELMAQAGVEDEDGKKDGDGDGDTNNEAES